MPGIVGLVTKMPPEWAEPRIRKMVEAMHHGPPLSAEIWTDESLGLYIGWTVRKNSFSDGMPVCNERGDITLVFSGEEYPEPGQVRRLKEQGHDLKGDGPSYLVHLYEEDPSFPARLNGRFHGLVADRSRGVTLLFNDRYGIHRLYYYESSAAFYFAAEAKAISAVCSEVRAPDFRGLGELVGCGCVLENRTVFEGLHVLPPASTWSFRNGAVERKAAYFDPSEWENQPCLDPEAYYEQLRDVFARNLPRYFNGREGIGMSLTGGLDTRMIMAWQKSSSGSLPCYSFGGMFRDCEDVRLARRVAQCCHQPYQVIPVGTDFLSRFSEYAERTVYRTDGCASVRCSADLYANEIAAQIAPVRMTGNYGSEILRRLVAFNARKPTPELFTRDFAAHISATQRTLSELSRGHALSFIAFRQMPWHHYGLLSLEQTQVSVRSPFLDNDMVRTAFQAPDSSYAGGNIFEDNQDCVRLISDGNQSLKRIRTDRGSAGVQGGRLLKFITRSVLAFTFRAEYAYDYGMPQAVSRIDHLLSGLHLERLFLGRHKFLHFRVWYRDALSNYVREMLLDPRTLSRPYLQRSGVEAVVQGHLRGGLNYTTEIHQLLTLELLQRLFLDS
jgi:asparagine synthase (glutamine-hydrolysing)